MKYDRQKDCSEGGCVVTDYNRNLFSKPINETYNYLVITLAYLQKYHYLCATIN
ncbi:hypothetical protein [Pedobacter mendelii]|uniref:hypothetical protein n=1 Tax=Pedobacter mendelii TaxID=1908240 RepID=UPI001666E6AC|nr:hypothetical protein [Pedobacter mendelii]